MPRDVFVARARAKVNLCLHVTGRRDDGLHRIESLVVFPDIGDDLSVAPAADIELELDSSAAFARELDRDADNLALRAAQLLVQHVGDRVGAKIRLSKHLPVGAGIGGGSADAAATMRLLQQLWNVTLAPEALTNLAWQLGADVPACLRSENAIVRGAGEVLCPAPAFPKCGLVLLRTGGMVATRDVFAMFAAHGQPGESLPPLPPVFPTFAALVAWLQLTRNDLLPAIDRLFPQRATMAQQLRQSGAAHWGMSGSGLTHYGLFPDLDSARVAARLITRWDPECWCVATRLPGGG